MDIIIFGASKLGIIAKKFLQDTHTIKAFCDNNNNKHNSYIDGIPVISVEQLLQIYKEKQLPIIIASMYYNEICKQLKGLGIYKEYINIFQANINSYDKITNDLEMMDKLTENKSNNKVNVHLMVDHFFCDKFIDIANKNLDEEKNIFIIYDSSIKPKYMKINTYSNVIYLNIWSDKQEIFKYIEGCNKLFLHFLDDEVAKFLYEYNIRKKVDKIYWLLWGGDFYSYLQMNLFENETKKFLEMNKFNFLTNKNSEKYKELVIREIDFILTPFKLDYYLIKQRFKTDAILKWFSYPLNINLDLLDHIRTIKNNKMKNELKVSKLILLGNSATYENNHIEILNKLSSMDNNKFAIICPLAYGDNRYGNEIIKIGKAMFDNRFVPLTKFIEAKEYFELLQNVDIVIMNHIRQQAGGNVYASLYLGKKVYLNSKSTLYKYYREKKLQVFKSDCIESYEKIIDENYCGIENIEKTKNIYNDKLVEDTIVKILNE